jgi:hypothetical protein
MFDTASLADRVNLFTTNLQDFRPVTPTLAKVVLTFSGTAPTREEIRASIAKLFNHGASAVASSFRSLERTSGSKTVAGFIRYQSTVLEYNEKSPETAGRYKHMAAAANGEVNMLMDTTDKSMWQVKAGNTGKYLVRHGEDDLSELMHLARNHKTGMPTLAQLANVPAEAREFASFVDVEQEEIMHGYVVAKSDDGQVMTVIAFEGDGQPQDVHVDLLVEVANLEGEDEAAIGTKLSVTAGADKAAMIEYYKKAYGYAPDYLKMIIETIDQHAFA